MDIRRDTVRVAADHFDGVQLYGPRGGNVSTDVSAGVGENSSPLGG
jgi:hypothetical protein